MKTILIFGMIFLSVGTPFAQYTSEDAEPYNDSTSTNKNPLNKLRFKDRLYTGGNMNLGVSNGILFFMANPIVGYRINQKLSAGIGGKYVYFGALGNSSSVPNFSSKIYGGSLFSKYLFTDNLFAHTELELLNAYNLNPNSPDYGDRALAKMFMAGGGYSYRLGPNASFQIMLLYDFINDVNSPYKYNYVFGPVGPPIIYRIGFVIGL